MKSEETRNLILAIVLSAIVLIGWSYLFPQKPRPIPPATPVAAETANPSTGAAHVAPGAAAAPGTTVARPEALAASPRVKLEAPAIGGSINLDGGVIDDVFLKGYRQTINPSSPDVVLFSPVSAPAPYWAETGFVTADKAVKTPNRATRWTSSGGDLTPSHPITLTWDNGEGLVFTREIAVDDKYMFTVIDKVENKGDKPVSLNPYALIQRTGAPKPSGYSCARRLRGVRRRRRAEGAPTPASTRRPTGQGDEVDRRMVRLFRPLLGLRDRAGTNRARRGALLCLWARGAAGLSDGFRRPIRRSRARRLGRATDAHIRRRARSLHHRQIHRHARNQETRPPDRLGLALFRHQADVPPHRFHLQICRQFRLGDPVRDRDRQGCVLPARQPELPLDGEDEAHPAEAGRAEGAISWRRAEAATGADGADAQGRRQPCGGLLCQCCRRSPCLFSLYKRVLDHVGDAPCAVHRLDKGPLGPRPDKHVQSVRAYPVRSDGASRCSVHSCIWAFGL